VIESLEWDEAETYWSAIPMIEAQETLLQIKIASWPTMKERAQTRWHRQLSKIAYPQEEERVLSGDELAARLKAAMNG
jgi:hypothetical protein